MTDKGRILFVDDESRIVSLLKMIFRSDYEVHTATSGVEALAIVESMHIDVIVSDQRMPGMLGIDLLSRVRQISPGTMRILLTGYSDLVAIIGAVNEGEVYRFLNKPWDHAEIKAVVAEAAEIGIATGRNLPAVPAESDADVMASGSESGTKSASVTLLVLEENQKERDEILQLFRSDYQVLGAASIDEALLVLEQYDVGVIVSEARVSGEDTGGFLRMLKQQYPLITTVMLCSSADSDLVVKLINEVQIFRFALKPIRNNVFRLVVSGAMKEHHRFRVAPELTAMSKVSTSFTVEQTTRVSGTIARSLAKLRSRFSFFLH
ncbi:response regulator receiver modulated metal dependent phosphohydrolase [Oxalobacteraceae bacterium IMCC9480]|nr:response regulator receiver modulated metal dependent phosphohydrolase [Oxalobacteraceae bacterium IMCC9480]